MKKNHLFALVSVLILSLVAFYAGQSREEEELPILSIGFAPTVDPERILSVTQDLELLLVRALESQHVKVGEVKISVMTSFDAAAESLLSGANLIAFMPTTTFVMAENETIAPFLEGLRFAQNVDSTIPYDWNSNIPNTYDERKLTSKFYSLILVGPSDYGLTLRQKHQEMGSVSWQDLNQATVCFGSNVTSSAAYVYPSMWLYTTYGKTVNDLDHVMPSSNSTEIASNLATGICDVSPISSMSRITYQELWIKEWGRPSSIWDETYVIGVSEPITNGMFAISKTNVHYSEALQNKLALAFLHISNSEEGRVILRSINLEGVTPVTDGFLDSTRAAIDFIRKHIQ